MDSERIEKLLAKYWDCETSLAEEKELRDLFSGSDVPAEYESVASLFRYYDSQKSVDHLGENFEKEMMAKLKNQPMVEKSKGRVVKLFYDIARVAAVVLVVVTAGYYINQEYIETKDTPYVVDTFEDPKAAFDETKKALMMISKNFKKGRKQVGKLSSFNDAKEKVKDRNNEL